MIQFLRQKTREAVRREMSKFKWGSSPQGKVAINVFASLKNSMVGKDAILMCNGPSLNKVPFEKLDGFYIIGLNKINLLFERTMLRPNMIVAVNQYVIEQSADFYNQTDIPLMLSQSGISKVDARKNVTFLNSYTETLGFTFDPGKLMFERATVTYTALQIAFHLGFKRVAIVGADHNFNQTGQPSELQVSKGPDSNHFDPRYFGSGTPWQLADLEGSELAYELARKVYEENNRKLYNCTEGGRLEIFQRMHLSEFIDTSPQHK